MQNKSKQFFYLSNIILETSSLKVSVSIHFGLHLCILLAVDCKFEDCISRIYSDTLIPMNILLKGKEMPGNGTVRHTKVRILIRWSGKGQIRYNTREAFSNTRNILNSTATRHYVILCAYLINM